MKKLRASLIYVIVISSLLLFANCTGGRSPKNLLGMGSDIPHLEKLGNTTHIIVKGKPFIMLGGELHNSSTSGFKYMEPIWKRMAEANLNTVIAATSWELVEPIEGHFDFALVDSMIMGAREEGLKLVILWFGSWKNGESTYVPAWVKKNPERFPLISDDKGKTLNVLSTLSEESCTADSRAFAALMKHIRKIDSKEQTIIMVQVENEVGTLRTVRDFSEVANLAFNGPVPAELIAYLEKNKTTIHPGVLEAWEKQGFRTEGTWEEVFGKGMLLEGWKDLSYLTEELFMAWNYAKYIEKITSAGKAEYALPMYVNAWLKQPGYYGHAPGNYPCGGPTPQTIDIWKAAAPSVDFLAPDIYIVDEFRYVCKQYTLSGNPLFIPETTGDAASAARVFYALGEYHAMGYAPFGIDGRESWANNYDISHIQDSYLTINQLIPLINEDKEMRGLLINENSLEDSVIIGGFHIIGTPLGWSEGNDRTAGALIISTGPGEYFIAGRNMSINFSVQNPEQKANVSFILLEEGTFEKNEWIPGRRLNGDEFRVTLPSEKSRIFKVSLYTY